MTTMGDSPSEALLAARRQFEETSSSASARMGASAQASAEAGEKANESNKQFTENVQKIDRRVRELIEKRAQDAARSNEIQVGGEDDDEPEDEVAVEFKELIENYPISTPAETTPESAGTADAAPQAGSPTGSQPASQAPPPDPKWQVQAGRFGRRDKQQAPPSEPPKPPAPPKPAPRRPQPAFDDDDDYENQTWLR